MRIFRRWSRLVGVKVAMVIISRGITSSRIRSRGSRRGGKRGVRHDLMDLLAAEEDGEDAENLLLARG